MRSRIRPALLALAATAGIALAANLVILLVATAIGGPVVVEQPSMTMEVTAGAVIAASIVGALAAAVGSLVLLRALPVSGIRVLVIAGAALTLLSLGGTLGATTPTGVAALALMHLVTGTVVVVGNAVIHSRTPRSEARAPQPTR